MVYFQVRLFQHYFSDSIIHFPLLVTEHIQLGWLYKYVTYSPLTLGHHRKAYYYPDPKRYMEGIGIGIGIV